MRDAAATAVGACMKVVGDKAIQMLLGDLGNDELKMGKIREYHDQHVAECAEEDERLAYERGWQWGFLAKNRFVHDMNHCYFFSITVFLTNICSRKKSCGR